MAHEIEVPSGPSAPLSNVATGVKAARVVALLTAVAGAIASLMLLTYDGVDASVDRAFAGIGVAVLAVTLALATLLLFLAGWAESTHRG